MPLAAVGDVLDADAERAAHLVEEHVRKVVGAAATEQHQAAAITASWADEPPSEPIAVSGPVFAAAVEQVLSATTRESEIPVLNGVLFECGPEAVTVTTTDRYRLATRTLLPVERGTGGWSATVHADDLRSALPGVHRSHRVSIALARNGVRVVLDGSVVQHCRQLAEPFPDHRAMLEALPAVTTRVAVEKVDLFRALEASSAAEPSLAVRQDGLTVTGDSGVGSPVPAQVTGPDLDVRFQLTTLYPAVSTAIGADLLLDLRGAEQPATVRSADHGDLTTLAMPIPARPRT
ncbi:MULTISPECIES: hypothetical protein [unclassified Saccharopolyspora]|uniref:DNA polymerase III subunit beta family protein n=1 Tax=unclassified Saccharopolyspora TaxID=2646250 RepID=UPI001CD79FCC|nr:MULTISPECIES: hypothetical protein [unclassified Saccharopolyspora]MCA1189199.1 hypothetical protein [Saccharopolyspora sp. 6T]MCA1194660.1 hypothetical protein [Saccharopolyspora sp. 6V]MCA1282638.1 hypothetical protein [Saccharopolyspora sp. 7B]